MLERKMTLEEEVQLLKLFLSLPHHSRLVFARLCPRSELLKGQLFILEDQCQVQCLIDTVAAGIYHFERA